MNNGINSQCDAQIEILFTIFFQKKKVLRQLWDHISIFHNCWIDSIEYQYELQNVRRNRQYYFSASEVSE